MQIFPPKNVRQTIDSRLVKKRIAYRSLDLDINHQIQIPDLQLTFKTIEVAGSLFPTLDVYDLPALGSALLQASLHIFEMYSVTEVGFLAPSYFGANDEVPSSFYVPEPIHDFCKKSIIALNKFNIQLPEASSEVEKNVVDKMLAIVNAEQALHEKFVHKYDPSVIAETHQLYPEFHYYTPTKQARLLKDTELKMYDQYRLVELSSPIDILPPISASDEAIVDSLVAKRTASMKTRQITQSPFKRMKIWFMKVVSFLFMKKPIHLK
jgi:hypothetical protein